MSEEFDAKIKAAVDALVLEKITDYVNDKGGADPSQRLSEVVPEAIMRQFINDAEGEVQSWVAKAFRARR